MTPLVWPVSDNPFTFEPIAMFFDYYDAVDFVNRPEQGFGTRERYIAPSKRRPISEAQVRSVVERDLRFTIELQRKDAA